ncbi:hypothetical protein RS030_192848 [Cryptosporidium xiaoi]|uniref:VTT domain-containing protein n=1 Tax=Cryptosporidium xiaoi TaxID=659607 RepID=A0AAV9XYV6_9CRYT
MSEFVGNPEVCSKKLNNENKSRVFSYLTAKIAVTLIVSLVFLVFYYSNGLNNLIEWVSSNEKENAIVGIIVVIFVTSVLISVFVPLEPITVSASYLLSKTYGNYVGATLSLAIVISSLEMSSLLTVYMIRLFVPDSVRDNIKRSSYFNTMNTIARKRGILLIVLIRLIPLIPFSATNYLLGIIDTTYSSILVGNLGSIPMSAFFVLLGLSASNLQFLDSEINKMSVSPRYFVIIIATVLSITILCIFTLFSILVSEYQRSRNNSSYTILDEQGQTDLKQNHFCSSNTPFCSIL